MPKALTPEEVAERAMKRRASRQAKGEPQAKGDTKEKKTATGRDYTIRYGKVDAHQLSDWCIVWQHPGYSRPPAPQPNEGEHGAKSVKPPHPFYLKKKAFYTKLEESVKAQGVKNPIFALSYPDGTFCRYGTSRLWVAKKHHLSLPVIIADYCGNWDQLEELADEEAIRAKYTDQPALLELHKEWMRIDGCPQ